MNDYELGASYGYKNMLLTANLYYMMFNDEIVNNGQLDRFGEPVTGNVKSTIHRGIELSALYKTDLYSFFCNATVSKNYIKEGKFYIDSFNSIDLTNNKISGFPEFLLNFGMTINESGFYAKLNGKYVGAFYSDNYDVRLKEYLAEFPGFVGYADNINDPYFTADFFMSYTFTLFIALSESRIFLQVNNIFNKLYSANAIGAEFFPGAERNFITGIKVGL